MPDILHGISREIQTRRSELPAEIDTIYVGGGTPSLAGQDAIQRLLDEMDGKATGAEITLEANPDDLTAAELRKWKQTDINRLSIGVQSFFEEDLRYMNRVHTAHQAEYAIKAAQDAGFENITIDLIYGTPGLSMERWAANLEKVFAWGVPHLSAYALTVEEDTPLFHLIRRNKQAPIDDSLQADQFLYMADVLELKGWNHYEISNACLPGFPSRHNSSYWAGEPYLGIGPSAHSFDGMKKRRWNISNNGVYLKKMDAGEVFWEEEILSDENRFNEWVMTRMRLKAGVIWQELSEKFGPEAQKRVESLVQIWSPNFLFKSEEGFSLTAIGRLQADGLSSCLFLPV